MCPERRELILQEVRPRRPLNLAPASTRLRKVTAVDSNQQSTPGELTLYVEKYLLLSSRGEDVCLETLCQDAPHLMEPLVREIEALREFDVFNQSQPTAHSGSPLSRQPTVGQRTGTTVASTAYLIQRFHARGGCSEIYVAQDQQLGRTIAIKFLRPDVEGIESFQTRLRREAEITSRLDHPGIISIHAKGTDEHGLPFYVMRFVDGQSLGDQIRAVHQRHPSPNTQQLRKLLGHFVDVCQTVAFAHSRGVIHRDLKPDNIVTGNFGETYLIDWGLAKQVHEPDAPEPALGRSFDSTDASPELTHQGHTLGTPAYMSPEQAHGKNIGPASDIFNLGATLYSILTGKGPYHSDSLVQLMHDARHAVFPPPESRNPHADKALAAICAKALSADPEQRYLTAGDLAEDIEHVLADQPVTVYRDPWGHLLRRWIKNHRTLVTSVATTCLAAILILAISTMLLLDSNRNLAQREAEANFHKNETRLALADATENLYGQKIALAHTELNNNNLVRADEILNSIPTEHQNLEWHLLKWMVNQYSPKHTIETHGNPVPGLDLSADGNRIVIGQFNGLIRVISIQPDQQPQFQPEFEIQDEMELACVALSPDGNRLAVSGRAIRKGQPNGAITIWNLVDQTVIKRRWGQGQIACITWSDDGQRVATSGIDGSVKIRDSRTLDPIVRINRAHRGPVRRVRFLGNSGSPVLSAGEDGTVKIWAADGQPISQRHAHSGGTNSLWIDGDSIYSAGSDQLIRRWTLTDNSLNDAQEILVGNQDHIESIDLSPDGRLLASGGLDRVLRIWDLKSQKLVAKIPAHTSHIRQVRFDESGKWLFSAGDDGGLKIWSLETLIHQMPAGGMVQFLGHSNQLISAGPTEVSLWDAQQRKPVARFNDYSAQISAVCASRLGTAYASLHFDGSIQVQGSGKRLKLAGSTIPAMSGAFSLDATHLFVGRRDGSLERWSLETQQAEETTSVSGSIRSIGLLSDGTALVVVTRNGKMFLCDPSTLTIQTEIQAHPTDVLGLAVHPALPQVATTGHDGTVKIWDTHTGALVNSFRFGASWLNTLAFTPDGSRLVTGSEHTVLFWDPNAKKEVLAMSVDRCVHSISFSHDGKYMAVAGEDPKVRVWKIRSD